MCSVNVKKFAKIHEKKLANTDEPELVPIGIILAVQRDANVPWTHGTILHHGDSHHNFRS